MTITKTISVAELTSLGKWPAWVSRSRTATSSPIDIIRVLPGDYSRWPLALYERAEFIGEDFARLGSMVVESVSEAVFRGFELSGVYNIFRSSKNEFTKNRVTTALANPFRLRYGSSYNRIHDNDGHRDSIVPPDGLDIVFVQLKTGKNLFNEITNNRLSGWSDCVQATNQFEGDSCGGTLFAANNCHLRAGELNPDGTAPDHYEQLFDIKTPAIEAPFQIHRNVVTGARSGKRTAGYPGTIHEAALNVELAENVFGNCQAGIFLKGLSRQNITSFRDKFIAIKSYGPTEWPTKAGSVICGPGAIAMTEPDFICCDRVHEPIPHLPRPMVRPRFIQTPEPQ